MKTTKTCACGKCNTRDNGDVIRHCPLSDDELDTLNHLKAMDPNKLAARLPEWAKPKLPPKQFVFVPGQKPRYPKSYLTRIIAPVILIPSIETDIRAYIRSFDALNNLSSVKMDYVSAMGDCHV